MQEVWYADRRDVVKWAALIHLVHTQGLDVILQIAFCRPEKTPYELQTPDGPIQIPSIVWHHFRNLYNIVPLGHAANVEVNVFGREFGNTKERRGRYFAEVIKEVKALQAKRLLVFFDPDTGLEPQSCTAKHVKATELGQVFGSMKPKDWLVLYQHRPLRFAGDWKMKAEEKFALAVGVAQDGIKSFFSTVAPDVVFFAVEKRGSST